jgi:cold shock CspA family protein
METGTVKFFHSDSARRYGFLTLPDGSEMFFHWNDGGPVIEDDGESEIQTRMPVKQPIEGDVIRFRRGEGSQGKEKAIPWCFATGERSWENPTADERQIYRLVRQRSRPGRNFPPRAIWTGKNLATADATVPGGIPRSIRPEDGGHVKYWFEIERGSDQWQKCDAPRGIRLAN